MGGLRDAAAGKRLKIENGPDPLQTPDPSVGVADARRVAVAAENELTEKRVAWLKQKMKHYKVTLSYNGMGRVKVLRIVKDGKVKVEFKEPIAINGSKQKRKHFVPISSLCARHRRLTSAEV